MLCSSVLSMLLLPTAIIASWYISYADTSAWAPAAFVILTAAVGISSWQDRSRKPAAAACSSGSQSSSLSPDATLQLIKGRRSVFPKDFTGDNSSITREKLQVILEAARWAPTHKLTEPWHFVVMEGESKEAFEDMTIRLCQELLPAEKAEQTSAKLQKKKAKDWPKVHCYIALCMKRHDTVPEWEEMCALACAVQNMQLQASSMGIHGYWSSWQVPAREAPEMQQLLGLDSSRGDRCLGFLLLGTAETERLQCYRPKRQPLSEKVVWMS